MVYMIIGKLLLGVVLYSLCWEFVLSCIYANGLKDKNAMYRDVSQSKIKSTEYPVCLENEGYNIDRF